MSTLLVKNIGILQTPLGNFKHAGRQQGENQKIKNAAVLIEDGIIKEITGQSKAFSGKADTVIDAGSGKADTVIDAEGGLVTPGLVDGHTHLVFGGYRENEIPLKLKGAGYLDILRAGGGILDTVQKTRAASPKELYDKSLGFLREMMTLGVTTCEVKSGYGLDLATEIKMLETIRKLNEKHPMDLVSTFMGAHAVPTEFAGKGDEYIDLVCREMLPAVKEKQLAEFCDAFCEDSVFNVEQSKRYLQCAKKHGFGLKIHADEIEEIGGSELAGKLQAISAEHLIAIGQKGINAMAKSKVIAMLLPATSFYLGKNYAPAKELIKHEIPVALASDFNPGSCPSLNLQFVLNLAYLKYGMTPEEILTGVTINPACAINRGDQIGTLEEGKQGDLVIWDAPNMEMLCYRFGSNQVKQVIKKGVPIQIRNEIN